MDPFLSLIFIWPGTRIPSGYMACQGQLLAISEYDALYTLLGTTYGGDGVNTFALPDLRSRIPVGMGQGTGLSNRVLGANGGTESVTLTTANMAAHQHAAATTITIQQQGAVSGAVPAPLAVTATLPVNANFGSTRTPGAGTLSFAQAPDLSSAGDTNTLYGSATPGVSIPLNMNITSGQSVTFSNTTFALTGNTDNTGNSLPHENRQPFVVVNYIIAINGLYPPQQ